MGIAHELLMSSFLEVDEEEMVKWETISQSGKHENHGVGGFVEGE